MKITKVTGYGVHPGWRKNLVFVKVETDAGIHGWGEAYSQYDRDQPVLAQINALGLISSDARPSISSISPNSRSTTSPPGAVPSSSSARSPASNRHCGTSSARR